ncbi:RAMP superfamily CRISPR-associated protein [Selenomonas artemidis]|jgi:CRISPR-associated ramp protein|uniref:RAMP superfamily CRISPR-associated protein n=1 Tax=Selenomonas artemidis TaxID=671224 RepID=UPI000403F91E|nr:RAMP superfamily CRISPR-associated protein [Selenomonas artemidis]
MKAFEERSVRIQTLSPLHLGSGRAQVVLDAEIVHDDCGLPYFPAKRFKGLLYESAVEVAEMMDACAAASDLRAEIDALFRHGTSGDAQIVVHDFHMEGAEKMHEDWRRLLRDYPEILRTEDVLELYTTVRYQTKIDPETGTAADTSLRNLRLLKENVTFAGSIGLENPAPRHWGIIALALRNLRHAGGKRNRGFGKIKCTLEKESDHAKLIENTIKEMGLCNRSK